VNGHVGRFCNRPLGYRFSICRQNGHISVQNMAGSSTPVSQPRRTGQTSRRGDGRWAPPPGSGCRSVRPTRAGLMPSTTHTPRLCKDLVPPILAAERCHVVEGDIARGDFSSPRASYS
jgi:hypothetical protein